MVLRYYSFSQWPHAGQIWGFLRSVWMVSEDVRQMIRNPHSHTCLEIISISEAIGFSPGQTRGLGLGWVKVSAVLHQYQIISAIAV